MAAEAGGDVLAIHSCGKHESGHFEWFLTRPLIGAFLAITSVAVPAGATSRFFPGAAPCSTTLQACIDGSSSGDTIVIASGTYTNPEITVNKALTFKGEGASQVTLQPDGTHRVMHTAPNLSGGVLLIGLTIHGGSCAGSQTGGGIFADVGTPLTLDQVDVTGNTCPSNSGGGILVSDDATLTDVNVTDNTAPGGAGGGLRANGNATITGGRFEHNISLNPGGGMRVTGKLSMTNVDVIDNSNTATGTNGGGIRADGGLLLKGGTIMDNTSANLGGGIYTAKNGTISGATFQSNSAKAGGGIYATGGLIVTSATFAGNTATGGNGGAIQATGAVDVSSTTFTGNTVTGASADGGGIFSDGGLATLTDVVFHGNAALHFGGGASLNSGAAIERSTFLGNSAVYGGGLALATDSEIRATVFQDNGGGAIRAQFAGPTHILRVFDSLFVSNTADSTLFRADDIGLLAAGSVLTSNTIAHPGVKGGYSITLSSFNSQSATATLRNNILSNFGYGIELSDGSVSVDEDYNDFFDAPPVCCVASGGHSITTDPEFIDPVHGNFRLAATSAAIDAGNNSALPADLLTDLDGLPRRFDIPSVPDTGSGVAPIVDMGAFELNDRIFGDGFEPIL